MANQLGAVDLDALERRAHAERGNGIYLSDREIEALIQRLRGAEALVQERNALHERVAELNRHVCAGCAGCMGGPCDECPLDEAGYQRVAKAATHVGEG